MALELYYEATPVAYAVAAPLGKGLIVSDAGCGQVEMPITAIANDYDKALCGMPNFIGVLDEYAAMVVPTSLTEKDLETTFIRAGEFVTEELTVKEGMEPLRTLMISGVIGRDIPGGKTIYGVEVNTNCQDTLFIGIASKQYPKEDFIFRKWLRLSFPTFIARPVVSGREFLVFVYTKGAGRFEINEITTWMKVTDRRGFNASPTSLKQGGDA